MSIGHPRALIALACFVLSLARAAGAETVDDNTRNAARSLAEQGKELFDKGDFERARDLFRRAYTLVPAPTIALYEARAASRLGRLVESEEAYIKAVRTELDAAAPEPFRKAVRDAERELLALQPRIPKVIIAVSGPGAGDPELSVAVDGERLKNALLGVEKPINPGDHVLTASVPGGEQAQVAFSIREQEHQRVELQVTAPAAAPSAAPLQKPQPAPQSQPATDDAHVAKPMPWQVKAGIAASGIGVAGVVTGIVAGALAGSRYAKAETDCPQHVCVAGSEGANAVQSFRTLRTVSTVGYIVGGVGVAAGVTLFVIAPSKHPKSSASLSIWVSGQAAGVTGAF